MDDLKIYLSQTIVQMTENMKAELQSDRLGPTAVEEMLKEFTFRDKEGAYWSLGLESQQWYRFNQQRWNVQAPAPRALEGPASLSMWAPTTKPNEGTAKTEIQDQMASNPLRFMETKFEQIRASYDRGELTSLAAQVLISDTFFLDEQKRFWALGFQSNDWYLFGQSGWEPAPAPLDPETLLDTHSEGNAELVKQALLDFLGTATEIIPEPITDPWDPPGHLPEAIRQCSACGYVNSGNHNHCLSCQTLLSQPAPEVEKEFKFCTECGYRHPRPVKFCTECGTPF